MLNVFMFERCYAECHYGECCYADCHYGECRYAECRGVPFKRFAFKKLQTINIQLTQLFIVFLSLTLDQQKKVFEKIALI